MFSTPCSTMARVAQMRAFSLGLLIFGKYGKTNRYARHTRPQAAPRRQGSSGAAANDGAAEIRVGWVAALAPEAMRGPSRSDVAGHFFAVFLRPRRSSRRSS